ncbi:MAG: YjfB family protein [Lachnospiraceae bacterium]|nr:YjfB family protein [Lachnospiraceae bacterium]
MDVSMMVTPNVTSMSLANRVSKDASAIGVALLDKSLDNQKEQGAGMVKMMEQSVAPHLGRNFDMSV